jgi:DNA-directed RNA polymerase specialized sigma24 family protein
VFELRYLLELSLAEIAERLGSNSNAVSQCVFRLVRKMRDCLRGPRLRHGGVNHGTHILLPRA